MDRASSALGQAVNCWIHEGMVVVTTCLNQDLPLSALGMQALTLDIVEADEKSELWLRLVLQRFLSCIRMAAQGPVTLPGLVQQAGYST